MGNKQLLAFSLVVFCGIFVAVDALTPPHPAIPHDVCGRLGSCFFWPQGCKETNCKVVIKYHFDAKINLFKIDIAAKTDGWIAFGLNDKPRQMGGSVGEVCMASKTGNVILKGFVNKGQDMQIKSLPPDVKLASGEKTNGYLSCSYTRPVKTGFLKDLNKPWFLISSWGKLHKHDDEPKEHETGDYYWSKTKINMRELKAVPVTTFGWDLIAVHASFMILAWVGFAASGIFYARYTKEVWPNASCRGNTLWFQLHRAFMLGSTILILCGFLVIIAEVKGWNQEMGAHPIIGIIVISLVCIQVVAGIARPSIGSARRYLFNWIHRFSGIITYILATITIFLGLDAMDVDIVVFIVYLIVMVTVVVGMEARKIYKSRTVTEVQYREEELDGTEMDTEEPSVFSIQEIFVRKAIALCVAGIGFGMSVVIIALIGHKAHVYHTNSKVSS